jgi:YspA, cpYpsA-related SLOG family
MVKAKAERVFLFRALDSLHDDSSITAIISGGARGADALAIEWAREQDIRHEVYAADWVSYGRKAGPIRNQQMIDEVSPDIVVAFPAHASLNQPPNPAGVNGCP